MQVKKQQGHNKILFAQYRRFTPTWKHCRYKFLKSSHIPTGTMSWYCGLLTVLNVLDGLGRTGGPVCRESSPTCKHTHHLCSVFRDRTLDQILPNISRVWWSTKQLEQLSAVESLDWLSVLKCPTLVAPHGKGGLHILKSSWCRYQHDGSVAKVLSL